MQEKMIMHEKGDFFVLKIGTGYEVLENKLTHSVTDSVYAPNDDGLSLAIARCEYLGGRTK